MSSQTQKHEAAEATPPDPFRLEWDPNPWVVCSRRSRSITVPASLLMRDPSEKERAEWAAPSGMALAATVTVTVNAGATFLGAGVTQWLFSNITSHTQVPKGAPPEGALSVLWPKSSEDNTIKTAPRFKGRDSQVVDPEKVCAAWRRVLDFLRANEARVLDQSGHAPMTLFTPVGGFDAPELVVCRVADLFSMRSEAGQHAQPHVMTSIEWAKDGRHLGALHDYAIRHPGGHVIATACQQRLQRAPGLGPVA